jgi:hypothetical protein
MHIELFGAVAAISLVLPAAELADDHANPVAAQADHALAHDTAAWDFVEGITTEVGPRQPGTEAEARGRVWAMA